MAKILFVWELGGGMAHMTNIGPLAKRLSQQGHEVVVALRDLSRAPLVFSGEEVQILQSPTKVRLGGDHIESPPTFAHILHNVGFGDASELLAMVTAWRSLYRWIKPDAIVFDHSPTALLAAGGASAIRILLGAGFYCPPDCSPMPRVRPMLDGQEDELSGIEFGVLSNVNSVRQNADLPAWGCLSQLFSDVDESILTTFEELDPYQRTAATYWGVGPNLGGELPVWPKTEGPRIFGYLKPFPALPNLLGFLNQARYPTLIYGDDIPSEVRGHFSSETLHFANKPLDLALASKECELAILNGTHATTSAMLLAGKPVLQIPISGEQYLTARRTTALGYGPSVPCTDEKAIIGGLKWVLESRDARLATRRFAARYDGFDPNLQVQQIASRIEHLLVTSSLMR